MFRFKQFNVNQENAPFKVGTDGILLGAWCTLFNINNILDLGTGTGIIALMLAQRSNKPITAIEINTTAYLQAKENVQNSPWKDNVQVVNTSLQNYCNNVDNTFLKFDLIVSNPPYFINSLKSTDKNKSTARHTDTLSHKDILVRTKEILSLTGKLCVVLPAQEGTQFIATAQKTNWFLTKLTKVYPNPNKPVKRLLIELSLIETETTTDSITIETGIKRHDYTNEYKELTKDFYIIF